nr:hypothetical protein [Tanacetum cinerariifolium]
MGYEPNNAPFASKPKTPPPPKKDNPAKDAIYHQCGEVGHWRRNCPVYLAELMKKKKLTQGASTLGIFTIELYSFPSKSWTYDTGCSTYICITTQGLRGNKKLKPGALSPYMGDGHHAAVEAIGSYHLELPSGLVIVLNNCHYAPSITRGVISVSRWFDDGFINRFDDNNVISVSKNNLVYFMPVPRDDTMADQRTMTELLRAPTEGYAEAIVFPPILAEQFELKHSLINMITSDQFFRLEKDNPYDHIRAARRWLEKEPPRSILTWEDLFDESFHEACDRYKDLLRACPHHGFTELHQLNTFYNALNPADQDSLNSAAGGNLLERRTQDVLKIIKNKSKIAKLTHAVNQQTSVVTTAMTTILKQFQATPHLASVKGIEEICITCGGAHPDYQCLAADGNTFSKLGDNIQGYVAAAAVNYNQCNSIYRPLGMANQIRPPGFAQPNVQNNQHQFSQPQGYNRGNNFNPEQSYQAPTQQNQVVPLTSTSGLGSLPRNTIANPKGELKSITSRSGIVLDRPSVPTPPPFINPEEDEPVEETLTDQDLAEYTIKVPSSLVKKSKPMSQRDFDVHQRDLLHPNIPYPSRMLKQKQQEKDEVQIHKF